MDVINWSLVIDDIMELSGMSKLDIAMRCKATRQEVSGWVRGIIPASYARAVLRAMIVEYHLDVSKYKISCFAASDKIGMLLKILENQSDDVIKQVEKFAQFITAEAC